MVMKHFQRLSDWIDIERIDDKNCPECKRDIFKFQDTTYRVYDFTRIHNNPWFGSDIGFPSFIAGIQRTSNERPLFIEIDDSGEHVRLYHETTEE